jgi:hypothetical protein
MRLTAARQPPRQIRPRQKFAAILEDTAPDLNDEVAHPRRRIRAVCVAPGVWRIHDAFLDQFLTIEQVDALSADEMLQEGGSA